MDHVVHNDDRNLDTHFKSQESCFKQQSFDFIGTVERMEVLIKVLKSRCGQKIDIEHENRTVRRKPLLRRRGQEKLLPAQLRAQRTLSHASELLTDELLEQLKSRYATDYELWQEALN